MILQECIDTSPHGDDRLLVRVRRVASAQTIRGTDAGSRSTGLPPCALKGAVLLLPKTRDLDRGQQRAACQLLLADTLRCFRGTIKIRRENMSEANPPIPEASSEQTDLRLTVFCQVVAILIASADADDMPGLSAAILLRSTLNSKRVRCLSHVMSTLCMTDQI